MTRKIKEDFYQFLDWRFRAAVKIGQLYRFKQAFRYGEYWKKVIHVNDIGLCLQNPKFSERTEYGALPADIRCEIPFLVFDQKVNVQFYYMLGGDYSGEIVDEEKTAEDYFLRYFQNYFEHITNET